MHFPVAVRYTGQVQTENYAPYNHHNKIKALFKVIISFLLQQTTTTVGYRHLVYLNQNTVMGILSCSTNFNFYRLAV